MQTVYDKIISLLQEHKISYQAFEHEPVRTSEEAARIRGTQIGFGAKALVFLADYGPLLSGRNKKPVLLVLGGDKRIDFKKAKHVLGCRDLRMATHEEVFTLTTVEVGGIPPLGNVLGMPTYLDVHFTQNERMDFNAGDKAKSIEMAVQDYLRLVNPTVGDIIAA